MVQCWVRICEVRFFYHACVRFTHRYFVAFTVCNRRKFCLALIPSVLHLGVVLQSGTLCLISTYVELATCGSSALAASVVVVAFQGIKPGAMYIDTCPSHVVRALRESLSCGFQSSLSKLAKWAGGTNTVSFRSTCPLISVCFCVYCTCCLSVHERRHGSLVGPFCNRRQYCSQNWVSVYLFYPLICQHTIVQYHPAAVTVYWGAGLDSLRLDVQSVESFALDFCLFQT